MKRTRLYNIWTNMKYRCTYSKRDDWQYYGGKGIKVCREWMDFKVFKKWALANGYKENLTIDRIDIDGDYEPTNCRFITIEEQQRNKSNNVHLTYNGETKILAEWAREYNLHERTLKSRLELGYSVEDALNKEDGQLRTSTLYEYKGKKQTLSQWARECGMSKNCLHQRLKRGWALEKALETPVSS